MFALFGILIGLTKHMFFLSAILHPSGVIPARAVAARGFGTARQVRIPRWRDKSGALATFARAAAPPKHRTAGLSCKRRETRAPDLAFPRLNARGANRGSAMAEKVELHVEDSGGAGRPVILVHGWPLSGAAWEKQVPVLRDAGFRVLTYDRRGFGRSSKPATGYDYDTLTADLHQVILDRDLRDVTIVGFSMGGGEAARYIPNHGADRVHSLVFAAAVPPYLMQTDDNPEGPLTPEQAKAMEDALKDDRDTFFDSFTQDFFTANEELKVTESDRQRAIELAHQSSQVAALGCMKAFGTTDFRDDLRQIQVPVLVLHGDADGIVPLEGSGQRTHEAIPGSELVVIEDAPHGLNVSHPDEFNAALLAFLRR